MGHRNIAAPGGVVHGPRVRVIAVLRRPMTRIRSVLRPVEARPEQSRRAPGPAVIPVCSCLRLRGCDARTRRSRSAEREGHHEYDLVAAVWSLAVRWDECAGSIVPSSRSASIPRLLRRAALSGRGCLGPFWPAPGGWSAAENPIAIA